MANGPGGRDWLSRTLRELRAGAGVSGWDAGRAIGRTQSRISRIEAGRFVPTEDEIRQLCRLYRASAQVRRELLQAAKDLRAGATPARVIMASGGAWKMQERVARIEAAAAEVCAYQPALVPGLIQTEGYARLVIGDGGIIAGEALDKAVAARMARASVLGSGRDFVLIMPEGALRWQAGSPAVMIGQLEHIAAVTLAWPNVRVGIIPQSQPARVFTTHGFSLYDRRAVILGTRTRTATITDAADVADYARLFSDLEALASFGAGAREILFRIAGEYRALA